MQHDLLSDALSRIMNAERVGKDECVVPNSKLVQRVLSVLKDKGYIHGFEAGARETVVKLAGKINELRAVKPRFPTEKDEFEKFEKRYLPSRDIGLIVVSTSQGVVSHRDAIEKGIGGKLLAYVY